MDRFAPSAHIRLVIAPDSSGLPAGPRLPVARASRWAEASPHEGVDGLAAVGCAAVPVTDPPLPIAEAIAGGARLVVACGERLARTITTAAFPAARGN